MGASISDLCDDILKTCLELPSFVLEMNTFSLPKVFLVRGFFQSQIDEAFKQLERDGYLTKSNHAYRLTKSGEEFAKNGGYKSQQQQQAIEKLSDSDNRILARLVNESIIETNSSIRDSHQYQKKAMRRTNILMALAIIVPATLTILNIYHNRNIEELQSTTRSLLLQEIQTQKAIDSLKILIDTSIVSHSPMKHRH
jgi:hypothetical protein